ncbi:uncharacterized protein LOC125207777 [Salvia hispanica]|uniref:uncharacterized protein LOC125207777 n=1 Tax=Salvia hispanica TaxID=49212 RepID=UPI00200953BE|nr:uncharacterized protein LOC125207777 [Salvia hispanica]
MFTTMGSSRIGTPTESMFTTRESMFTTRGSSRIGTPTESVITTRDSSQIETPTESVIATRGSSSIRSEPTYTSNMEKPRSPTYEWNPMEVSSYCDSTFSDTGYPSSNTSKTMFAFVGVNYSTKSNRDNKSHFL